MKHYFMNPAFSISQPHDPKGIVDKRAGEKHAVNAVQKTAMAGDQSPGILDLGTPF